MLELFAPALEWVTGSSLVSGGLGLLAPLLAGILPGWTFFKNNVKWIIPAALICCLGVLWLWERGSHAGCEARYAGREAELLKKVEEANREASRLSGMISIKQLEFEAASRQGETKFVEVIRRVPVTTACRDTPAVRTLDSELRSLGFSVGTPSAP